MLEAEEGVLSGEERLIIEGHLAQCPACSAIKEVWENIRADLERMPQAELPDSLESRIRTLCHDEINAGWASQKQAVPSRDASVPWPIWVAFAVLTMLTVALIIHGIEEFSKSREVTAEILLLLTLVLQNGLTLFFTPVVMRSRRLAPQEFGLIRSAEFIDQEV